MKPEAGPCFAMFKNWHYDSESTSCKEFTYGGCSGNENRFDTKEECEKTCNLSPPPISEDLKIRPFSWPVPKPRKALLCKSTLIQRLFNAFSLASFQHLI